MNRNGNRAWHTFLLTSMAFHHVVPTLAFGDKLQCISDRGGMIKLRCLIKISPFQNVMLP